MSKGSMPRGSGFARMRGAAMVSAVMLAGMTGGMTGALAQGTPEQRSACMDDAFKFCQQYIPVVNQIEACLNANKKYLSPACRAEFQPKTLLRSQKF